MSSKYPGGIISKTAPTPSGSFENSTAPGVWTLEQQAYWQKLGQWPTAGNTQNFIEDVFSTYLYTGTNPPTATQTVVNGIDLAGKGGLVWIKPRNAAEAHILSNTVTGVNNFLQSQSSSENSVGTNWLTAFNSNGFTVGNSINAAIWNLVSWTFRKQAKFFDIVTYTGNGTAGRTIAHNLGSVPGCIIVKQLAGGSTGGVNNWFVYHRSLGGTKYVVLDSTIAAVTSSSTWNNTDPTSTVFTIGGTSDCNDSGGTYIAYVFAHDAGGFGLTGTDNVISCGTFTTDGSGFASVNLGYEAQWFMYKSVGVGNWTMEDVMRGSSMSTYAVLTANTTDAESAGTGIGSYPQATGVRFATGAASTTYIYITIRRGPMRTPTVGTSVFNPVIAEADAPSFRTSNFNSGMDSGLEYYAPGFSGYPRWSSRLTGPRVVVPSGTTAETSVPSAVYYYMNGYNNQTGFGANRGAWMFKRAPGFFDVVAYTGTASGTIAHNLTVVPQMIIGKFRNSSSQFYIYHEALGTTSEIYFNSNAVNTPVAPWTLTSTTFSYDTLQLSGITYITYLFATLAGVSKVGSYTGTGALQTINCGFTTGARFVLIKRYNSTGDWYLWDSARGIIPSNDPYMTINTTDAEVTGTDYVDTTSVGFDVTAAASGTVNVSGGLYIFLAIA